MSKQILFIGVGLLLTLVLLVGGCKKELSFVEIPTHAVKVSEQAFAGRTSFTCPESINNENVDFCLIGGTVTCNTYAEKPIVLFRWSVGTDYDSIQKAQISYRLNPELPLKIYKYYGITGSSGCTGSSDFLYQLNDGEGSGTGTRIYKSSSGDNLKVCVFANDRWYGRVFAPTGNLDNLEQPQSNCNKVDEVCDKPIVFDCAYKLCPSNDPSYSYCLNHREETFAWTESILADSSGTRIEANEQVFFNPSNAMTGVQLPSSDFILKVQYWDETCGLPVTEGGSCDLNDDGFGYTIDKYCTGSACPPGTTYYERVWCMSGGDFQFGGQQDNVCVTSSHICYKLSYNKFFPCVDTSSCNDKDESQEYQCPQGMVCKPRNSNIGDAGWGSCVCASNDCDGLSVGQKRQSGAGYEICCYGGTVENGECKKGVSGCPDLAKVNCPTGLIYSPSEQRCVCDTTVTGYTGSCPLSKYGTYECGSLKEVYNCEAFEVTNFAGTETCYKWAKDKDCVNNRVCESGSCKCVNEPCSSSLDKKCEGNSFYVCEKDNPNNEIACWSWSLKEQKPNKCCLTNNDCSTNLGEECINNNCQIPEGQCFTNDQCPTPQICNTQEKRCEYPQGTGDFCTVDQANSDPPVIRCSTDKSKLQVCKKGVNEGEYVWDTLSSKIKCCLSNQDCEDNEPSTEDECKDYECHNEEIPLYCDTPLGTKSCQNPEHICVSNRCQYPLNDGLYCDQDKAQSEALRCSSDELNVEKCVSKGDSKYVYEPSKPCGKEEICIDLNGVVECTPTYEFVGVIAKDEYGINEKIKNITIDVTSKVEGRSGAKLYVRLIENGKPIKEVKTLVPPDGKKVIDFDYAYKKVGGLEIYAFVEVGDKKYEKSKNISIKVQTDIKLNCPIQATVGRDVTCTWKVYDAVTNTLIDYDKVNVILTQGDQDVPYDFVGTDGIKFRTDTLGSVSISVSSEKDEYLNGRDETVVDIIGTSITVNLKVDNKLLSEYGQKGITTGTHDIVFDVDESGATVDLIDITAEIKTPSGQIVPLIFIKDRNKWSTEFNFEQAGQTYHLSGHMNPVDTSKNIPPFDYDITTLKTATEDEESVQKGIIYTAGAVAIGIFGFIYLLVRRR